MHAWTNLGNLIDCNHDLHKTAIIDLGGETAPREFSFALLDRMANSVARALRARGLARGERVAILSANRAEYLAAYYGIMRAGLVAVPVNWRFPRPLIDAVLRDAGARLVFCDPQRRTDCPSDLPIVDFGDPGPTGFRAWCDEGPWSTVEPEPNAPAMFLYTSGSTGRPKGVVLSHQSHLWVVRTRLGTQDLARHRFLVAAPLYHMNALALAKFACAAHATIVLLPQFTARAYVEAIARFRCTWLTSVPPMIAMMLKEKALLAQTDLSSVECLRMGSAPVSPALMAGIRIVLPTTAVTNAYGTTEAGPVVFGPHPDGQPTPELSVGYAHPAVQLRLVDGPNRDAAEGVLEMRCPALMTGYHNRPDLTPPFTEDGFYITGDVFRRDAHGFYFFVGRMDDMFVSGGENIYPGEVEKMLETHPAIEQACVVPIDDDIKGQKPVAFIVPRLGAMLTEAEVKQYTLAQAPAYQHPRAVWCLEALPLSSTNKIDRTQLAAEARRRLPMGVA
jgi:acyl-CoA synthetase (AMP-forming)/AMP-acid ligase II